ncbi:MAG: transposase [Dolichospermum sp.]
MKTTRQIYCQYLLSSQINYTCTNLSEHTDGLDENSIYRYLKGEKLTPSLVWEKAKELIKLSNNGYIIFDDTVIDKDTSSKIEGVRKQYSGNTHGLVKGIGVVNCLYYNPELDKYWLIDFRIFDPDKDGKSKLNHVEDMLKLIEFRKISYTTVLMDTWYATTEMMLLIDRVYHKLYYCPIKTNRLVDDSGGKESYKAVNELNWTKQEEKQGKLIKINKFPNVYKHKLFKVVISTNDIEYIVTNDLTQDSTDDTQKESAIRWKIEQLHREVKQNTGFEKCQCRKNRSQRNHICCAFLVWHCLTEKARQINTNIYQIKQKLLDDYLMQELRNPSVLFE